MAAKATYKCKCCGKSFVARVADRARGWALYCSKRCKAIKQPRQPVLRQPEPAGRYVDEVHKYEYGYGDGDHIAVEHDYDD